MIDKLPQPLAKAVKATLEEMCIRDSRSRALDSKRVSSPFECACRRQSSGYSGLG